MALDIYKMPDFREIMVQGRMMDEDDWVEGELNRRRHEGLYESRLERMQREMFEESEMSD